MIESLRACKVEALKAAITRAKKTLGAGIEYGGKKAEAAFPKPKTPNDAAKYHDMRHDAMKFIERQFKADDVPGMPESGDPSIEELAQLSRGSLKTFLDKAVKAKKITRTEANKIAERVGHHKERAKQKADASEEPPPL
jgi:hypothetical protein